MSRAPSVFGYLRPTGSRDSALPPAPGTRHGLTVGLLIVVVMLNFLIYLQTLFNSPLLPGDWSPYQGPMLYYLGLSTLSLSLIAALPYVKPKEAARLQIQPGGFAGYTITIVVFGAIAWVLTLSYIALTHQATPSGLSDTVRLQNLVVFGVVVAPIEELFFRVALVPYGGWVLSNVAFGLFHAVAYSSGGQTGISLYAHLGLDVMLGIVLYFVRAAWGLGASQGAHWLFDLTLSGSLATAPVQGMAGFF